MKANGNNGDAPKIGRPLKDIKPDQVEELAAIGCTTAEIAVVVEASPDTLERRFAAILKNGRERMKMSLRRMQYTSAESGNVAMQIWLGKQYLDQREPKTEVVLQEDLKGQVEIILARIRKEFPDLTEQAAKQIYATVAPPEQKQWLN